MAIAQHPFVHGKRVLHLRRFVIGCAFGMDDTWVGARRTISLKGSDSDSQSAFSIFGGSEVHVGMWKLQRYSTVHADYTCDSYSTHYDYTCPGVWAQLHAMQLLS